MQEIVDSISESLSVDVCSLYRRMHNDSLQLVASHGLITPHPIIIPENRGLVGHVVRSQRIINIANPEQHPDYYFVANSEEETLHNFCGVPLVYRGRVNGVLVAQGRCAEKLDIEQETVMATLAMHLALLLSSLSFNDSAEVMAGNSYRGISGAPSRRNDARLMLG